MDKIIKSIKLNLKGKEVNLTIDQARALKSALDELFGKEVIKEIHHDNTWCWRCYEPLVTYTNNPCPEYIYTSSDGTLCLSA